jgi:CheY-like chemotaxis protein
MSRNLKVLIVDDYAFSRRITANKISKLGVITFEAESGSEALQLMTNEKISLIVLDLDMPKMNGFEFLGCIRGHPRWNHLPAVVLTGCEDRTSIERALGAGATSYLVKPLNWTAFGGHIKHLLDLACQHQIVDRAGHGSEVSISA